MIINNYYCGLKMYNYYIKTCNNYIKNKDKKEYKD